jgi:hypothetical protein
MRTRMLMAIHECVVLLGCRIRENRQKTGMLDDSYEAANLQFGPGAMQQHGFARNVDWEVASTSADLQADERDPCVEFVLNPSDYTLAMFPYKFKLVYTVTLHGSQLQTEYRCARGSCQLLLLLSVSICLSDSTRQVTVCQAQTDLQHPSAAAFASA